MEVKRIRNSGVDGREKDMRRKFLRYGVVLLGILVVGILGPTCLSSLVIASEEKTEPPKTTVQPEQTSVGRISAEVAEAMETLPTTESLTIIIQSDSPITSLEQDQVKQAGAEVTVVKERMLIADATREQIEIISEYDWVSLVGLEVLGEAQAEPPKTTDISPGLNIPTNITILLLLLISLIVVAAVYLKKKRKRGF